MKDAVTKLREIAGKTSIVARPGDQAVTPHDFIRLREIADQVEALTTLLATAERERDRALEAVGKVRMCVMCGRVVDAAEYGRYDDHPACKQQDGHAGCCFDTTPQEAMQIWRDRYYEVRETLEKLEKQQNG